MKNTFIALDLETTGFDAETDQVIEIAAIRFDREKVIDTFSTLINPQRTIPPMIVHMTGIRDEDLKSAPGFEDIKEKLIQFIGTEPIVGHNISFDVGFLNQKGCNLSNPLFDTLDMSGILLPGLPSYSLDTLTRTLKIEHKNKHRALSDTQASMELFNILYNKILEIDPQTMHQIHMILEKSTWPLRDLFISQKTSKKITKPKPKKPNIPRSQKALTKDQFNNFFENDGPLAKTIKDYESRESQKQAANKILQSFQNEKHLLIEAGTGTGKTIAYLLAAVYFAKSTDQKIVISTYTKNLQDQIMNKDIPLLQKALHEIDPEITFTSCLLKGRSNYISLRKLHQLMTKDMFFDHETTFLLKIIFWLEQTKTGDLDELNIQGKEYSLRFDICHDEFENDEKNAPYENRSFLKEARQKAENADIIIVNHALLLQDAQTESILPNFQYTIIDEAHHLEKVTTDSLTINLSYKSFAWPLDRLGRIKDKEVQEILAQINQALTRAEIFFGILGIFMEKHANSMEMQYQFLIKDTARNSIEWNKVKESATLLIELTSEIIALISDIEIEDEETAQNIKSITYEIESKKNDIKNVFLSSDAENSIQWTYKTYEGYSCIKSAPINIGQKLQTILFDAKKSIILTSATLRTENSFNFIRSQLNLGAETEEIVLESHFDYPDQVKIIIAEDLPRPQTEGYFKACSNIIENIIKSNGGRTLVLFTSKKALTATYMALAPNLKIEGYTVLAQGITGGKGKIMEHFKEEPESCTLFGTASFWEGIDIPGDILTCLVMQKLPFDPPTDPIIFSRGLKYTDSFNEYQLPLAILKFKQGFGRLIRTSKDKGNMVILDSRISQNSYGQKFLTSLPGGIKIEHVAADQVALRIKS